jgi:CubicO group peptidase (beta-lactamase class C family)
MYRPRRRSALTVTAVAAALLTVAGCATRRSDTAVTGVSAADARAIDKLFDSYAGPGVPGAAVVVIRDGRVAFARGYGLAELETNTPVTERTNFRLASLTKSFTAMAVMLLVSDGRLRLDDRVRDILPDFPVYGRDIMIWHLLGHTSGLRPYQAFVRDFQTRQLRDRDVLALLRSTDTLLFPPGSAFRYGDSGYAILALVVETVSRESFARFLHDRIFARAGMESTVAYEPGISVVPHRALGYSPTPTGFRPSDQSHTTGVLGDGGIYSSVRDLAAWDRALDEHRLLDARLQQLAWTPTRLTDGTRTRYGFGWFIDRDATGPYVSHHGETSGFTNIIVKYPGRRLTVVVLTNRRGGAPGEIAATITTLDSFRTALR